MIHIAIFIVLWSSFAYASIPRFFEQRVTRGRTSGGYAYLSGGNTFDEQRAIETMAHLYNLKIVFARPAGTLTTPLFVLIGFNSARQVEKISVRGPWFYIQLPPGGYTIMARFTRDIVLVKNVYVEEGRRRIFFLRGD